MTNGNGKMITTDEFLKLLKAKRKAKKDASDTAFAASLGVSQQFLSRVLQGTAYPGPKIAKALGYKQLIAFRPAAPFTRGDLRKAVKSLAAANVRPMGYKHNATPVGGYGKARKAAEKK